MESAFRRLTSWSQIPVGEILLSNVVHCAVECNALLFCECDRVVSRPKGRCTRFMLRRGSISCDVASPRPSMLSLAMKYDKEGLLVLLRHEDRSHFAFGSDSAIPILSNSSTCPSARFEYRTSWEPRLLVPMVLSTALHIRRPRSVP